MKWSKAQCKNSSMFVTMTYHEDDAPENMSFREFQFNLFNLTASEEIICSPLNISLETRK